MCSRNLGAGRLYVLSEPIRTGFRRMRRCFPPDHPDELAKWLPDRADGPPPPRRARAVGLL